MKTTIDLFKVADAIANLTESGIVINVSGDNRKQIRILDPQQGLNVELVFSPGHRRHLTITRLPAELYSTKRKLEDTPAGLAPELPVAPGIDPEPDPDPKPKPRKKGGATPSLEELENKSAKSKWYIRYNIEKNLARITIAHFLKDDAQLMRVQSTVFAERMSDIFGYQLSTARRHVTKAVKMGILKRQYASGVYWIELMINRPQQEALPGSNYYLEEGRPTFEMALDKAVDETVLP